MDRTSSHEYSDYQFGFVPKRNTSMATALVHDVTTYCKSAGSLMFLCSLDAEGAFDGIPHSVLFDCACDTIPDSCWKTLYSWYAEMGVHIKWQNRLGYHISVNIGTRQGGLTSSLLFNLFHEKLINKLSDSKVGVTINNVTYNVFCYADQHHGNRTSGLNRHCCVPYK